MPITGQLLPGVKDPVIPAYSVANSCRFNDGSSEYLHFTPSSSGNRRTMTVSVWFKGTSLADGTNNILGQYNSSNENNSMLLTIESNGRIMVWNYTTSAYTMNLRTNRLLRDPSAWYHVVVAVDTTQSTDTDRVKIYVNGVQETSFFVSTYPTQNLELFMNENKAQNIGTQRYGSTVGSPFDGYMAEFCFIDGQQLAPTSFGEFDEDTNIWKPIDVSGLTFGTNGYYLDFEDSSALGNDVSGNNNDFTPVNFASTDQSTDTCTNNFATMNPLAIDVSKSYTFSEGNLNISLPENAPSLATIGVSSGKWYAEVKFINNTGWHGVAPVDSGISANTGVIQWFMGNGLYVSGSSTATWGSSLSNNDIMGIALDMDNSRVTISQNGNWWGGSSYNQSAPHTYYSLVAGYDTYTFYGNSGNGTSSVSFNFGSPSFSISSGNTDGNGYGNFEYSVPSGYFSLCTKNLAEYG